MKKIFILLMLLSFNVWADSESVNQAVLQAVKGTKVLKVTLHPIQNSDSVKMTILTSAGEKSLILAKKHVVPALRTLTSPKLIGVESVGVSNRYINVSQNSQPKSEPLAVTTVAHRPTAAAMVTTNVISANQQASK